MWWGPVCLANQTLLYLEESGCKRLWKKCTKHQAEILNFCMTSMEWVRLVVPIVSEETVHLLFPAARALTPCTFLQHFVYDWTVVDWFGGFLSRGSCVLFICSSSSHAMHWLISPLLFLTVLPSRSPPVNHVTDPDKRLHWTINHVHELIVGFLLLHNIKLQLYKWEWNCGLGNATKCCFMWMG